MAQVDFHSGLDDKTHYACRLLRKIYRSGATVCVYGTREQLTDLDQLLWTFDPDEFIPHVRVPPGAPPSPTAQRTPIWLVERPVPGAPATVAVNLGIDAIDELMGAERIIEIVSADPADRDAGRKRWKRYEAAGHALTHHALGSGAN